MLPYPLSLEIVQDSGSYYKKGKDELETIGMTVPLKKIRLFFWYVDLCSFIRIRVGLVNIVNEYIILTKD